MKLFSPSTRGFYDREFHESIPEDAVEISDALHKLLLDGQSSGQVIAVGTDGMPFLEDKAPDSLAVRRARAWARIQAERDRRIQNGGFMVQGNWFHSDTFSRTQHLGMLAAGAKLPPGTMWKTMCGKFVPMTPALAEQVFMAAAASDPLVFAAAEVHKQKMHAAPDPEAYDFSGGWPVCYFDLNPGA